MSHLRACRNEPASPGQHRLHRWRSPGKHRPRACARPRIRTCQGALPTRSVRQRCRAPTGEPKTSRCPPCPRPCADTPRGPIYRLLALAHRQSLCARSRTGAALAPPTQAAHQKEAAVRTNRRQPDSTNAQSTAAATQKSCFTPRPLRCARAVCSAFSTAFPRPRQ